MCGKNSLNDIKNNEDLYNYIIKIFNSLKNKNIDYVPISYLLKKLKYDEEDIYYTIHNLLEEGILELYEFERCPICSQEELIKINQSKSICSHCKDIFFSDFIIEKLKLSDRI